MAVFLNAHIWKTGTEHTGTGTLLRRSPHKGPVTMIVDEQRRRVVRRIGGAPGDIPAMPAARQQRERPRVLRNKLPSPSWHSAEHRLSRY